MKTFHKTLAGVLAALMLAFAFGCSGDTTWVYKSGDVAIPAGVYLYYLYNSFKQAESERDSLKPTESSEEESTAESAGEASAEEVTSAAEEASSVDEATSKPEVAFADDTVDGTPISEWIQKNTEKLCKQYVEIDNMLKEYNVYPTEEEIKTASATSTSTWNATAESASITNGAMLEGFGISKDSYNLAVNLLNAKKTAVFFAIFGDNGTNPVSQKELEEAIKKDYTAFDGLFIYLLDMSTYQTFEEATTNAINDDLKKMAEKINAGGSFDELATEFKTSYPSPGYEVYYGSYVQKDLTANFTEGVINQLTTLEDDKAAYVDDFYIGSVVVKRSLDKTIASLSEENSRKKYQLETKEADFTALYEEKAESVALEGNNYALGAYTYKRFQ